MEESVINNQKAVVDFIGGMDIYRCILVVVSFYIQT